MMMKNLLFILLIIMHIGCNSEEGCELYTPLQMELSEEALDIARENYITTPTNANCNQYQKALNDYTDVVDDLLKEANHCENIPADTILREFSYNEGLLAQKLHSECLPGIYEIQEEYEQYILNSNHGNCKIVQNRVFELEFKIEIFYSCQPSNNFDAMKDYCTLIKDSINC